MNNKAPTRWGLGKVDIYSLPPPKRGLAERLFLGFEPITPRQLAPRLTSTYWILC